MFLHGFFYVDNEYLLFPYYLQLRTHKRKTLVRKRAAQTESGKSPLY